MGKLEAALHFYPLLCNLHLRKEAAEMFPKSRVGKKKNLSLDETAEGLSSLKSRPSLFISFRAGKKGGPKEIGPFC